MLNCYDLSWCNYIIECTIDYKLSHMLLMDACRCLCFCEFHICLIWCMTLISCGSVSLSLSPHSASLLSCWFLTAEHGPQSPQRGPINTKLMSHFRGERGFGERVVNIQHALTTQCTIVHCKIQYKLREH